MLLRRLSLSHVDEPRKRYEGYDVNAKEDKRGLGHDSSCVWLAEPVGRGAVGRPDTIGWGGGGAQGPRGGHPERAQRVEGSASSRPTVASIRSAGETRIDWPLARRFSDAVSTDARSLWPCLARVW